MNTIKTTNFDPYFLHQRIANRLNKRILINNTRKQRALRMINYKMSFTLAAWDDDDDPGIAAAQGPEPIVPGGFDGCLGTVGLSDPLELFAMPVLA